MSHAFDFCVSVQHWQLFWTQSLLLSFMSCPNELLCTHRSDDTNSNEIEEHCGGEIFHTAVEIQIVHLLLFVKCVSSSRESLFSQWKTNHKWNIAAGGFVGTSWAITLNLKALECLMNTQWIKIGGLIRLTWRWSVCDPSVIVGLFVSYIPRFHLTNILMFNSISYDWAAATVKKVKGKLRCGSCMWLLRSLFYESSTKIRLR